MQRPVRPRFRPVLTAAIPCLAAALLGVPACHGFTPPLDDYRATKPLGVYTVEMGGWHAGEDAPGPGGTPVFATADGVVSYSGPMAGYGWLLIVDHPDDGVYSLYGHLSTEEGAVEDGSVVLAGDQLGSLAYDHEDGSGGDLPDWEPHLHFGIRTGQRADYPDEGDRRWMAGYTEALPTTLGWRDPASFLGPP